VTRRNRSTAAEHAEIAQRYAWKARQQPLPDRLAAVRRAEIRRLYRHRLGNNVSRYRLDQHIVDKLGEDWESCGAVEIAHRARLTLQERMALDIRRLPAIDVTRSQAKTAYRVRRKWKDGNRKRETRTRKMEAVAMSMDLSVRREPIVLLLKASSKQMDVMEIAEAVKNFPAWRCPDGSRMAQESRQRIVRRELDSLESDSSIRQDRKMRKLGFRRTAKWVGNTPDKRTRGQKTVRTQSGRMKRALPRGVLKNRSVSAQDSYLTARTRLAEPPSGCPKRTFH
jgi:hypothetical protein